MRIKITAICAIFLVALVAIGMRYGGTSSPVVDVRTELPIRTTLGDRDLRSREFALHQDYLFEDQIEDQIDGVGDADVGDDLQSSDLNIVDKAAKFEKFHKFLTALKASGLTHAVASYDSVTIFAPTNKAFEKLSKVDDELLLLPGKRLELKRLLANHIVPTKVVWRDLFGRTARLKTIGGAYIDVDGNNGVQVNGARIEISDIVASNGVIHAIDSVFKSQSWEGSSS
ncbi:MAG: fasciclin domain-containing protein [Hyphomicrobiaceae bacterium]